MITAGLRRFDAARNMARFYAMAVQPTLFGQWAVVRRWGRINTDGSRAETWFEELPDAIACAQTHTTAKLRRGYTAV